MGSSASCSMVITPTGKSFYFTGETIKGYAILTVDNSTTVKYIDMNITGELIYEEVVMNYSSTSRRTVRSVFFSENYPLSIPTTNGISYNGVSYLTSLKMLSNRITSIMQEMSSRAIMTISALI